MSDISLPPEKPREQKKSLLDNSIIRGILLLAAFTAPFPVLMMLVNFFFPGSNVMDFIHKIADGSDDAIPSWPAAVALLPSAALLFILGRTSAQRVAAFALLVLFACAEIALFMKLQGV